MVLIKHHVTHTERSAQVRCIALVMHGAFCIHCYRSARRKRGLDCHRHSVECTDAKHGRISINVRCAPLQLPRRRRRLCMCRCGQLMYGPLVRCFNPPLISASPKRQLRHGRGCVLSATRLPEELSPAFRQPRRHWRITHLAHPGSIPARALGAHKPVRACAATLAADNMRRGRS
eukprot:168137-Chlamydomonas_euryale.AAC.3